MTSKNDSPKKKKRKIRILFVFVAHLPKKSNHLKDINQEGWPRDKMGEAI
jgi:hypothetical protein